MPLEEIRPKSPDPYILNQPDQTLARLGHLNYVIRYLSGIEGQIVDVTDDILAIQGDITNIEGDITTIQGDITTVEGDVTTVQGDITNIQNTINNLLGSVIKNNLTATTDPTVNDDITLGYTTDSIWYNTSSNTFWACTSNADGAAVWGIQSTGLLNNMTALVAPTVTDDSGDGYSIGSGWFIPSTGVLYFAQDVTVGAAIWTPSASFTGSPITIGSWSALIAQKNAGNLKPGRTYFVNGAIGGSSRVSKGYFYAIDVNKLAPEGLGLMTNAPSVAAIVNRPCKIRVAYANATAQQLVGYEDDFGNQFYMSEGTSFMDVALNCIHSSISDAKVWGGLITVAGVGNFIGSGCLIKGNLTIRHGSLFNGTIEEGGQATVGRASAGFTATWTGIVERNATLTVNPSTTNCTASGTVGFGGTLTVIDCLLSALNINVPPGETLSITNQTFLKFDMSGNTDIVSGAAGAVGGTVTALVSTGTVIITNGSTSVTVVVPNGLFTGQRMNFIFNTAQAATTWTGTFNATFFPATSAGAYKIDAVWNGSLWT